MKRSAAKTVALYCAAVLAGVHIAVAIAWILNLGRRDFLMSVLHFLPVPCFLVASLACRRWEFAAGGAGWLLFYAAGRINPSTVEDPAVRLLTWGVFMLVAFGCFVAMFAGFVRASLSRSTPAGPPANQRDSQTSRRHNPGDVT